MTTTWILVANASSAVFLRNDGPGKGMVRIKTLQHAASREKASDLVTDRPGQNRGNGHGAYVPAKSPKAVEADRFALELARELDHGRIGNAYQRLILVASPHFLGLLNGHLDTHVAQLVSATLEKDYTRLDDKALAGHLEDHVFL